MTRVDPTFARESPALAAVPGVRHGFFTRRGGISGGLYESNNVAFSAADDAAAVTANRARCADHLGMAALVTLNQKHTADVIVVDAPWTRATTPVADALVTRRKGVALGILTADCGPLLFADAEAGVIGAAHAGWKGALDGVIANTVAAMETLGAHKPRIVAALGPCIAPVSYEVGPEFVARFTDREATFARFFAPSPKPNHAQFDLPAFIAHLVQAAGLQHFTAEGADTCAAEDRFFSYRRSVLRGEKDYGRQLSAIGMTP
jgi:YfiH family protein